MYIPDTKNRPKRGKITGWSAASRRRLRQLLVSSDLAVPSLLYGATLTCPWAEENWDTVGEEWRLAMMAFSQAFTRAFPGGAMVYRTELQQRGAPHLHAVVYLPASAEWAPSPLRGIEEGLKSYLYVELLTIWGRVMGRRPWTEGAAKGGFNRRGVVVEALGDKRIQAMRYVCDHASKRKQAQLGWQGRQWGVIGGKRLERDKPVSIAASEKAMLIYARLISRLARYRIRDGRGPFGSWLSKRRRSLGTVFVSRTTRARLKAYAETAADGYNGKPSEHAELLGKVVGTL